MTQVQAPTVACSRGRHDHCAPVGEWACSCPCHTLAAPRPRPAAPVPLKGLDDVFQDLVGALAALEDFGPGSHVMAPLDAGQRLMLTEAWHRIDQVISELTAAAAAVIVELEDDRAG